MLNANSTISTLRVSYNKDSRVFVADISDFGPGFKFGQVYPDSCDEGMRLVSHKTGHEADFVVVDAETNDGDVLCWKLSATRQAVRRNPNLAGVTMTIYND